MPCCALVCGSISDGVSASREILEFWADPTSPYHRSEFGPTQRILLHCASGGRSALAADTLRQMGYSNVAHLDGGFTAWKESGRSDPGKSVLTLYQERLLKWCFTLGLRADYDAVRAGLRLP
jgi:hypothetical protein